MIDRQTCQGKTAEREQRDAMDMLAFVLFTIMLVSAVLILALGEPPAEDFTDTGVGCVEDCLDPDETKGQS